MGNYAAFDKLRVLREQGVGGFAPPGLGEGRKGALVPLPAPDGEMRGVETLPAQESTDLTGSRQAVALAQNTELVQGGEAAPAGPLDEFRVRGRLRGGGCGDPCAPLAYGSLRSGVAAPIPLDILLLQQ